MAEWAFDWGDGIDDGAPSSCIVVDNTYEAPFVHHFHLEPYGTLCIPEEGGISVLSATQHPFVLRRVLATMLGLEQDQVRVRSIDMGGGFGGKGYPKIEPLAAVCSLALRRPIRIALNAEESFLWGQREASHIRIRTGFSSEGDILFQDIDADFLIGAYTDISPAVVSKTTLYALGPYRTPRARVRSRGLFTTTAPSTAFRGFGAPHMNMAIEGQMNAAAHLLGLDPLALRLRNARHRGDEIYPSDRPADGDWPELLRRVAAEAGWNEPVPAGRGRGIAFGMKANSPSITSARVHLAHDGTAVAYVGTTEMGQGQRDTSRILVADALGLPIAKVRVVMADTAVVPFDSWTASSRSTVMMGNAVLAACSDVREQLGRLAAEYLQVEPADPSLVGETVLLGSRSVEIAQLVRVYSPDGIIGHGTFSTLAPPDGPPHPLGGPAPFYLVVATAVEVHLDRETGQVVIDRVVHGTDAGKVINVRRARRVDEGGIVMGQSLALSEGLVFDESGRLMNGSSLDYRIATVADMPDEMSELYLENGDGPGPFGAKGLAEGAILAIGPAIAGAILDLTGVHLTRIPMTPERVWAALQETSAVREPVAV